MFAKCGSTLAVLAVSTAMILTGFVGMTCAPAYAAAPAANDVLVLEGSAQEVGAMWGKENRASILQKYQEFISKTSGQEEQLRRFARHSIAIAEALHSSFWITELNAIADEIGADRELYTAFTFGRYRDLAVNAGGCTSFVAVPPATKDGQIIIHKTRDTGQDLQAAYVKKITAAGLPPEEQPYKFFGEMGTSDTGISFFVNEKGLAGVADVPPAWQPYEYLVGPYKGKKPDVVPPKYDGLMNHYTLRYIAEHAQNVEEAANALHFLVEQGYVASGSRGTNYLFVDAQGKTLQIQDNCYKIIEENTNLALKKGGKAYPGIYFTVPRHNDYGDPADALIANYGHITVELADSPQVAKHPATWHYNYSQSAFTAVIDPKHPETLSTIFVTLPAYGYSIPFLLGADATPKVLLNGSVYEAQRTGFRYNEFYEAGLVDEWREFIYNTRNSLEKGEDVKQKINDNFIYMVNKVIAMNGAAAK